MVIIVANARNITVSFGLTIYVSIIKPVKEKNNVCNMLYPQGR